MTIGPVTVSLYTMMLGLVLTVVGLQGIFLGCVAQVLFDYTGRATRRWLRVFPYTRTVLIGVRAGRARRHRLHPAGRDLLPERHDSSARPRDVEPHLAVLGLTLAVAGFSIFVYTLVLHGSAVATAAAP